MKNGKKTAPRALRVLNTPIDSAVYDDANAARVINRAVPDAR